MSNGKLFPPYYMEEELEKLQQHRLSHNLSVLTPQTWMDLIPILFLPYPSKHDICYPPIRHIGNLKYYTLRVPHISTF